MVKMSAVYEGQLHCKLEHGPSRSVIETDAPVDNMGKGEKFSPTDLVGAALLSCIMTTIGIVADRDKIDVSGMSGTVEKDMALKPARRIGSLKVHLRVPGSVPESYRSKLEHVAQSCPVTKSLHPEVQILVTFEYV